MFPTLLNSSSLSIVLSLPLSSLKKTSLRVYWALKLHICTALEINFGSSTPNSTQQGMKLQIKKHKSQRMWRNENLVQVIAGEAVFMVVHLCHRRSRAVWQQQHCHPSLCEQLRSVFEGRRAVRKKTLFAVLPSCRQEDLQHHRRQLSSNVWV